MNVKRARVRLRRFLGPLLTGLLFLAPVLLTVVLLEWVMGYLVAAFGPDSFLGGTLFGAGLMLTTSPTLAFLTGLGMALALIWGLGMIIQNQARDNFEGIFDGLLGRLPVIGTIYRPLAQLIRMIGSTPSGELKGMAVVSVRLGDNTDILGLLATPEIFDIGDGPRHIVMLPTAPVPVGGALIFVAVDCVRVVPGLGVDDLAKFYVSMGSIIPADLRRQASDPGLAKA